VLLSRERGHDDRVHVELVDATAHRAVPLRPGQQFAQHGAELLTVLPGGGLQSGAGRGQRLGQVLLHPRVGDHRGEEPEERLPGVVGAQRLARIVHDPLDSAAALGRAPELLASVLGQTS
jgi:hypothetical protein